MDDFEFKFKGDTHTNHLVKTMEKYYDVTVDSKGELYVDIKIEWDYKKRTLDTQIPNFTPKVLNKYQHQNPAKPQHAPEKAVHIKYGSKIQMEEKDNSPHTSTARIKHIKYLVGTFAWYAREVYPKMAETMSSIASRQSKCT